MGIDPSLRNTGVVIADCTPGKAMLSIVHSEVIQTSKDPSIKVSEGIYRDVVKVSSRIHNLIHLYKPAAAAIEQPPGGAKSATALRSLSLGFGLAIGVAVSSLRTQNVMSFSPMDLKKYVRGDTSKEGIIEHVRELYGDDALPSAKNKAEHIADAFMIAEMAALRLGNL